MPSPESPEKRTTTDSLSVMFIALKIIKLYPRRESNPDQRFRKPSFYPFNYRGITITLRSTP